MKQFVIVEIWTRAAEVKAENERDALEKHEPVTPDPQFNLSNWHVVSEKEIPKTSRTISSVTLDPVTYEYVHQRLKAVGDDRGNTVILLDGVAFQREADKIDVGNGAMIERVLVDDPVLLRRLCRESWAAVLERDRRINELEGFVRRLADDDTQTNELRAEACNLLPQPTPKEPVDPDLVTPTVVISPPRKTVVGPEGGVMGIVDPSKTPEFRLHLDDGKFNQPADGVEITKPGDVIDFAAQQMAKTIRERGSQ
jgi:hypothetical protein